MTIKPNASLFNRILCPIDFDDESLSALRLGRVLAKRNDAVLSILHVMTPDTPGGVVLREDREKAQVALERIAERELAGINYEVIVKWGNRAKEIVAVEAKLGTELCVMPTCGRMGASHWFRRSTAEQVLRVSSCPVLMVRPNSNAPSGN